MRGLGQQVSRGGSGNRGRGAGRGQQGRGRSVGSGSSRVGASLYIWTPAGEGMIFLQ